MRVRVHVRTRVCVVLGSSVIRAEKISPNKVKKVNLFMQGWGGGAMSKCTRAVRTVICGLCVKMLADPRALLREESGHS